MDSLWFFMGSTQGLKDSLGTRRGPTHKEIMQEPEVDTALMDTVCFRFFYGVLLILWFSETGPFANCLPGVVIGIC